MLSAILAMLYLFLDRIGVSFVSSSKCVPNVNSFNIDGFDFHFNMGPAVELVNVALGTLSEDELEQDLVCFLATALARDTMIGKSLRAVVLTNPHNPTGRCYSSKILMAVAGFCQKYDIHLIVDEIYALSRCRQCCSHENDFVSILALDLESIKVAPARIHCVWGTSKDFGSSGTRMV